MSGDPEQPLNAAIVAALDAGDVEGALALLDGRIEAATDRQQRYALLETRGRLLAALGDHAEARRSFSNALAEAEASQQRAIVLTARAEASAALGDIDGARADLREAATLASGPADAIVTAHLLGRIERDGGDLASAIDHLRWAQRLAKQQSVDVDRAVEVTLDLAMALRLAGATDEAIVLLAGLPDDLFDPLRARVLLQLGTTYGFAGEIEQALAAYDAAMPLLAHPLERAAARYNRAVVLREAGRLDEAAAELRQSLADNGGADPAIACDGLLLAGIVARELNDPQGALDALREASELASDDLRQGRARLELGTTLAATGLYGLAIDELTAALALVTTDADRSRSLRLRGLARRELGQLAGALADIEDAAGLTDDPAESIRLALTAASLLAALGDRPGALARAVLDVGELDELSAQLQALVQRGTLRSELGDLDGAIDDLANAADLAEALGDQLLLADILADLGALQVAVGDHDGARAALGVAAEIAGTGSTAYQALMTLGAMLLEDGEVYTALEAYERAAGAADDRDGRARAFVARAGALLRYGEYTPAAADYARALALSPSQPVVDQATIGQRTVESELASFAAYRETLTKTIAAHDAPDYRAKPTLERAMLALLTGDYEDALIDATRATTLFRLAAERAKAQAVLALTHTAQGRCAEALAALAEADTLDPDRGWLPELAEDWRWQRCPEIAEQIVMRDA